MAEPRVVRIEEEIHKVGQPFDLLSQFQHGGSSARVQPHETASSEWFSWFTDWLPSWSTLLPGAGALSLLLTTLAIGASLAGLIYYWPSIKHRLQRLFAKLTGREAPAPLASTPPGTTARSAELGPPLRGNETSVRRHPEFKEALVRTFEEGDTLPQLMATVVRHLPNQPAVGYRRIVSTKRIEKAGGKQIELPCKSAYQWLSYSAFAEMVDSFGSGLARLGIRPRQHVLLFASTRYEWQVTAQACFANNFTVVTAWPGVTVNSLAYVIQQTAAFHIVTEEALLPLVSSAVKQARSGAQTAENFTFIILDEHTPSQLEQFAGQNQHVRFESFHRILNAGRENKLTPVHPPTTDDVAVIMYTGNLRGTGEQVKDMPKGVILSHGNILAFAAGIRTGLPMAQGLRINDVLVSYLPLSHVLALSAELTILTAGAAVGYASPSTLTDENCCDDQGNPKGDLAALKPTLMCVVPLILERMRNGIQSRVLGMSWWKRAAFQFASKWRMGQLLTPDAITGGTAALRTSRSISYRFNSAKQFVAHAMANWKTIPEWLIEQTFRPLAAQYGGRLRYIFSGGAALPPTTQAFVASVLGCPVLSAYGCHETAGGGTLQHPQDPYDGSVGGPIPSCEIKLVDIPEMGYTNKDTINGKASARGEICVRGPIVSRGLYKQPTLTGEAFKEGTDGQGAWFYTGDVGMWQANGTLMIIDRKKDLIKMANGEYIALGYLESIYRQSVFIYQICLFASPECKRPVALVVPESSALRRLASKYGVRVDAHSGLLAPTTVIGGRAAAIASQISSTIGSKLRQASSATGESGKVEKEPGGPSAPGGATPPAGREQTRLETSGMGRAPLASELPWPLGEVLGAQASTGDKEHRELALLCESPVLTNAIRDMINRIASRYQLSSQEHIGAIRLVPDPFTIQSGLLTENLTVNRHAVYEHYADMWKKLCESADTY